MAGHGVRHQQPRMESAFRIRSLSPPLGFRGIFLNRSSRTTSSAPSSPQLHAALCPHSLGVAGADQSADTVEILWNCPARHFKVIGALNTAHLPVTCLSEHEPMKQHRRILRRIRQLPVINLTIGIPPKPSRRPANSRLRARHVQTAG